MRNNTLVDKADNTDFSHFSQIGAENLVRTRLS